MVRSNIFKDIDNLKHYFFTFRESQTVIAQKLLKKSYYCEQVHKKEVATLKDKKYYPDCDGLISFKKATILIRSADCLPIFFFEKNKKIIAAIHAGWRGLIAGIINNTGKKMIENDLDLDEVIVSIGPHIGKCCYKVDKSLIDKFLSKKFRNKFYRYTKGNYYIDLSAISKLQLIAIGISESNIEDVNICTSCNLEYASFRRDNTDKRNFNFLSTQ